MEQKFKVGDWVRSIREDHTANKIGKVKTFDNIFITVQLEDFEGWGDTQDLWNFSYYDLQLAYPSDHDLLDYAARDSKIAELTAENEALKAELEKYKPKPESFTKDIVLIEQSGGRTTMHIVDCGKIYGGKEIARKTVTITEGEDM